MTHSHLVITKALNILYICHVLFVHSVHSLSLFPGGEACPEMCQALVALFFFFHPCLCGMCCCIFFIAVLIFPFE